MAVKSGTEALVGMRRLKNFLLLDENVVEVKEVCLLFLNRGSVSWIALQPTNENDVVQIIKADFAYVDQTIMAKIKTMKEMASTSLVQSRELLKEVEALKAKEQDNQFDVAAILK